jgi:hypothetical protein
MAMSPSDAMIDGSRLSAAFNAGRGVLSYAPSAAAGDCSLSLAVPGTGRTAGHWRRDISGAGGATSGRQSTLETAGSAASCVRHNIERDDFLRTCPAVRAPKPRHDLCFDGTGETFVYMHSVI